VIPPVVLATTATIPGGVWRHVRDLAAGLTARGQAVNVALDRGALKLRADAAAAGLAVGDLNVVPRGALLHVHLADTFDRRATRLLLRHHRRGPVVVTEHLPRTNASDPTLLPGGRTPGAGVGKALFKRAQYAATDHVIAVSRSSAEFLQRQWRLPARRVAIVRNGLDPQDYPALPPGDDRQLATLGTLNVQKGHDVLLLALQRVRLPWKATFLGDGPQRAQLVALGGRDVVFAGWQAVPATTVATAALVCMPSRWEAFPYAALEAGLWGRPLLAAAVDGPDEIVVPEVTGVLVPPEDPDALAAALDRLAENRARLHDMGARAREHVSTRYTLDAMVQETAEVYARVTAGRR
jgi:glycosyltransferase involved in cell wall biosynthesis